MLWCYLYIITEGLIIINEDREIEVLNRMDYSDEEVCLNISYNTPSID